MTLTRDDLLQARGDGRLEENCIVRKARKEYRCIGAEEFRRFWAVRRCDHGSWQGESRSSCASQAAAEAHLAKYADRPCHGGVYAVTERAVEAEPNPEYRPTCLGDINPGDTYVEYLGDTPGFWQSGTRYCASCAEQWVVNNE